MRNWIRRWLGVNQLEEAIVEHGRSIVFDRLRLNNLQHDMELARAAIRENTLPMEDRIAASDRIAEEAIKKMRGY